MQLWNICRQQLTEARQRSQEELNSMRILDELPNTDNLKCVLRDGSQIRMLAGLEGIIHGIQRAEALGVEERFGTGIATFRED